jgi:transcriptional regulator with PAS, ATPase and Fis domain
VKTDFDDFLLRSRSLNCKKFVEWRLAFPASTSSFVRCEVEKRKRTRESNSFLADRWPMPAVRQSSASWNKFLEDLDQPIWVVDPEWRIVLANKALQNWWGQGGELLVGQEVRFSSVLAPDPAVFTSRAMQVQISHPRDETKQLTVYWLPAIDAQGVTQSAWAWGTPTNPRDQDSPPRIKSDTDWNALLKEHRARWHADSSLSRFVGESLAMQIVRKQADFAAQHAGHVWIVGRPGSGRRKLARTIQALNPAREAPCAEWDAAVLTPELLHRHVTDFLNSNQMQRLKNTTLPAADVLLLHAEKLTALHFAELKILLEKTPVRFLLTSNVTADNLPNLDQWPTRSVAEWSVLTIEMPPLASRPDDLPLLAQQLLNEFNLETKKQIHGCSLAALELLAAYRWPGEVAELAAVLRAAHHTASGQEIQPADLPSWLRQAESALRSPRTPPPAIDLDQQLAEIERELLARALRLSGGNKTQAAKLVGWSRNRLLRRAEELGLIRESPAKSASPEPEFIPDLPFEPEE